MSEHDSIVDELRVFLVKGGETPFAAASLAEAITVAAEVLTQVDVMSGNECRTARERVRRWMRDAREVQS